MLNLMSVLMVGFDPAAPGWVLKFSRAAPSSGGTKLFKLKTMKAFFTGKIPADWSSLRPKMLIATVNS